MRCCDPLRVRASSHPPVFHWETDLSAVLELCQCANAWIWPPSLPPSKFSPRSVVKTACLTPPLVDNSRTPTHSSASSSCRLDTQAVITTMIQINSWVCSCCATLGRVRPGEAAGSGWNTGVGLLEVCVGRGARTEGQGRADRTPLSSAVKFREMEPVKSP